MMGRARIAAFGVLFWVLVGVPSTGLAGNPSSHEGLTLPASTIGVLGVPDLFPGVQLDRRNPLDQVERFMEEGRYGDARMILMDWWEGEMHDATRTQLQRGLWLRALLTVDPTIAERDYRRLVVEFPGGPWSDEALLRLARIAELMDDREGAITHLDLLLRDYPGSPLRAETRSMRDRLERGGGRP